MAYPHEFVATWFPRDGCATGGYHAQIAKHVPIVGRVLDVGCGANHLQERFRTATCEVWGADFERHPDLKHAEWFRLLQTDGGLPFANDTFDVVCSHMVMEHVSRPAQFLGEIQRVLKPGGVYVGHSISSWHYITWLRRTMDLAPHACVQWLVKRLYGREEHDTFPTCYRMNSRRALGRIARETGFEWIDWEGYANQGYFAFSPLAVRAAVLWDWTLEKICLGMGRIYFTVALRKPARGMESTVAHAA